MRQVDINTLDRMVREWASTQKNGRSQMHIGEQVYANEGGKWIAFDNAFGWGYVEEFYEEGLAKLWLMDRCDNDGAVSGDWVSKVFDKVWELAKHLEEEGYCNSYEDVLEQVGLKGWEK